MMSEVTVQEMTDFLVYAKEINARICNRRSLVQDRVVATIFANDLSGAILMGGSKEFRQALGTSGKISEDNYPRMAGPTLLLNMPRTVPTPLPGQTIHTPYATVGRQEDQVCPWIV
jgi:hypothetical protein